MATRQVHGRKASTVLLIAGLLSLVACVQPGDPETVGGIIEMTDADYIAWVGFPKAAVSMVAGRILDGNRTESRVQFETALVTPAQIAAAPAVQCASDDGRSVVSSRLDPPGADDMDIPGTQIMTVICQ